MKNIIIFGPPGAGKGTISKRLSKEFGLTHISTGDIIRKNQQDKTKIGLLANKIVDSGGLLPDEIINEMIKQELINNIGSVGFIFDGFPRTSAQARMVDQLLNYSKTPIAKAIYLDVAKEVVLQRIIERGRVSERADDNKESFETRWHMYQSQTIPAVDYFDGRGMVLRVNGELCVDDVYASVKEIIETL